MSARIFVAVYRPRPGEEDALSSIVARHYPTLQRLGLVTQRPHWVFRAECGTLIEIGEWRDENAAKQAHDNPEIEALWNQMAEVADFEPLASLTEAAKLFPHFDPVHF